MIFRRHLRNSGNKPAVVATIHTLAGLQIALKVAPRAVDFFELRLDALAGESDRLVRLLQKLKRPLIITVRHHLEGGAQRMPLRTRRQLYEKFLPYAAFIDVEMRSLGAMAEVIRAARAHKVGIILSYHDFRKTPNLARLSTLARRASRARADVFKIATHTASPADVAVLMLFMQRQGRLTLSVMGMGRFGKASRLLFAQAGSLLNYGYLDKSQVRGQWPALVLKERIEEILED